MTSLTIHAQGIHIFVYVRGCSLHVVSIKWLSKSYNDAYSTANRDSDYCCPHHSSLMPFSKCPVFILSNRTSQYVCSPFPSRSSFPSSKRGITSTRILNYYRAHLLLTEVGHYLRRYSYFNMSRFGPRQPLLPCIMRYHPMGLAERILRDTCDHSEQCWSRNNLSVYGPSPLLVLFLCFPI